MEVLFVIDSVKDLDKKLSLISDNFGNNIKFFINAKLAVKVMKNKFILSNAVAIYSKNVNITIDKYIRSKDYKLSDALIYYSSAEIDTEIINQMRQNISYKPNTVYAKKRFNWWDKFRLWVYNKIIKVLFGMTDEFASIKFQYIGQEFMEDLVKSKFRNHIFSVNGNAIIELNKEKVKTYYNKTKFQKSYLINAIVFFVALIGYVLLERFINLRFWMYFLIIAILLAIIFSLIVLIAKSVFDDRFKK